MLKLTNAIIFSAIATASIARAELNTYQKLDRSVTVIIDTESNRAIFWNNNAILAETDISINKDAQAKDALYDVTLKVEEGDVCGFQGKITKGERSLIKVSLGDVGTSMRQNCGEMIEIEGTYKILAKQNKSRKRGDKMP